MTYQVLTISILITLISGSCKREESTIHFPLAEQYNINESKLIDAVEEFRKVEGALSLILCRDGAIIAEEYTNYKGYGADSIKNIMSVTKTFTGVLIGIAIDKGLIGSVNEPINKYLEGIVSFPDKVKENITIDQLLKMATGHKWNGTSPQSLYSECFSSSDPLQFILDLPLTDPPGTQFNYSDGASHLLSVIISQASGLSTEDFAKKYLFDQIGINKYYWLKENRGYNIGAAGLRITPLEMVKFGDLLLNNGRYEGKVIVSEEWVREMTSVKITTNNDVLYGPDYGYQIWLGNTFGHKYFMAMGWGGQFIFILPDDKCIITATCWTSDIDWQQAGRNWTEIIRIIVERIFPAIS